jgi:hypothetical protein
MITTNDRKTVAPFTECIVLATICGRSLSHRQQSLVERVYGDVSQEFWDRHQWLVSILTKRTQILPFFSIPALEIVDPMQLFTRMMAPTAILYLFKIAESLLWGIDGPSAMLNKYEEQASSAAQDIVNLTHVIEQLSPFKVSREISFEFIASC